MADLVTIREYHDRMSADIAKTYLEQEGVPAFVTADDGGGVRPDLLIIGRVQLMVSREFSEQALELLGRVYDGGEAREVESFDLRHRRVVGLSCLAALFLPVVGSILALTEWYRLRKEPGLTARELTKVKHSLYLILVTSAGGVVLLWLLYRANTHVSY